MAVRFPLAQFAKRRESTSLTLILPLIVFVRNSPLIRRAPTFPLVAVRLASPFVSWALTFLLVAVEITLATGPIAVMLPLVAFSGLRAAVRGTFNSKSTETLLDL